MKDGLTGLYNRLGYHELAYPLYRDTIERGEKLAVLFLDMDRLKYINDAYGLAEAPGVSLGYVLAEPSGDKSLEAYVQEADDLMYREKKAKKAQRPV